MSTRSSLLTCVLSCALAGAVALCAGSASAQVTQTDAAKTPLPQPVGQPELDLVNQAWAWNANTLSYNDPATGMNLMGKTIRYGDYYSPNGGYPPGSKVFPQFLSDGSTPDKWINGDAITLQGLFKWRGEKIDPVKDAKTGPGYFNPACGFVGEFVLMGGNCDVTFGWYNVTDPNSTTPPAPGDIYPFIPEPGFTPDPTKPAGTTIAQDLKCNNGSVGSLKTDGFCPLAWDNRHPYDLSIQRWDNTKVFPSGNIKADSRYAGGYVAFALIGNTSNGKKCTQTKYSMLNHNQRNAQGQPWVTTLVYQSSIDPSAFYLAFEDLPMPANDWRASGCDGDFNDFVFYVSGITCAGGNQACTTGLQGACSVGRTDCAAEGETPTCRPIISPQTEVCDNVDNDCDGTVDNGDNLCPAGKFCFQGQCVGNCSKGEFQCPGSLTCDTNGYCVDAACAGINCPIGQACRSGTCVDPCTTAVCPYGQICELGVCVDPCAGVTCPTGRVCEKGLCLADCSCRGCDAGLTCQTDGRCVDPACANVMCPAGQTCQGGNCVDLCANVSCPGGGTCTDGKCSAPTGAGGSGAGPGVGGGLGFGGTTLGSGGTFGVSGAVGSGATAGTSGKKVTNKAAGCACRAAGQGEGAAISGMGWLSALALASVVRLRRRRRAA